jgi:hypothetical protein
MDFNHEIGENFGSPSQQQFSLLTPQQLLLLLAMKQQQQQQLQHRSEDVKDRIEEMDTIDKKVGDAGTDSFI